MILQTNSTELNLYWPTNHDEKEPGIRNTINPHEVIYDFFQCFHLADARQDFWVVLKAALSSEVVNEGEMLASQMIFFYEKLNDLITANYILHMEKAEAVEKENAQGPKNCNEDEKTQ